jgi:hypothetical protein
MQVRRHVPIWRKKRPVRPRWVPFPTVGVLSAASVALLCLPGLRAEGLTVPISIQLARREWDAWTLLGFIGVVSCLLIVRLAAWDHWGSALVLAADLGLLGAISVTDPRSMDHLFLFLAAAILTAGWLWTVARDMEDGWLAATAYGAVTGVAISFGMLGIGERILVACALGGMNLLYYGYFVDA